MDAVAYLTQLQSESRFVEGLQHRLLRQFKVQAADWLDTCRELASWEDRHLVEAKSPKGMDEHAVMLAELERMGTWLADTARQPGFHDPGTAAQIQLTLQDLRDSRAMWHGQTPEARRKEILRDCFNES